MAYRPSRAQQDRSRRGPLAGGGRSAGHVEFCMDTCNAWGLQKGAETGTHPAQWIQACMSRCGELTWPGGSPTPGGAVSRGITLAKSRGRGTTLAKTAGNQGRGRI